jgi:hypothetical protein
MVPEPPSFMVTPVWLEELGMMTWTLFIEQAWDTDQSIAMAAVFESTSVVSTLMFRTAM